MTFFNTGDEECTDQDWLTNPAAKGVYDLAGSFVMNQIRNRRGEEAIPDDWFIPEWFVASIRGGRRHASFLVSVGKWKRVEGGYRFVVILPGNTPAAVREQRRKERDKKAAQRASGERQ
jgi:hypothetical protein